MESLWSLFCTDCEGGEKCGYGSLANEDPYSCLNHVLTILIDVLFLVTLFCFFIYKSFSRKAMLIVSPSNSHLHCFSLIFYSAIFHAFLGLAYLVCGVWLVLEKLTTKNTVLPLHRWLVTISQGFTWLILGLTISFKKLSLPHIRIEKISSALAFLFSGFLLISSIWEAVVYKVVSANIILNGLSFPGAILLLCCAFHGQNWPSLGKVEICNLKVRYRPSAPLVLRGISFTIVGGHKIGVVGRTGSGKTTLISVLFRLIEPTEGQIIVDGLDISTIGLHDLRSHFGIIPQDPTLFAGSVRYNLDPLSVHTDSEIWEVLEKCQLREAIQEKGEGLNSTVAQDGSNWSMGQRQLFCLGRALLKRSRILVLDEATASIDNATDSILQKTIRTEFGDCTVITVAHRIPTVMDCDMALAISDGKVVEYEKPTKLIKEERSLFGQLYKEYWSRTSDVN